MHPLREFLGRVGQALKSDAMAARVMGDWDLRGVRPVTRLAPPATGAEIAALERAVGQRLPESLRVVLAEVSREIDMSWFLRARYAPNAQGFRDLVPEVAVPDALREWDRGLHADGTPPPGAQRVPRFMSGGIRFSLEGVLRAARGVGGWRDVYADDPSMDEDTRAHYALIRDFMGAGLPVMTAPNGDWLAIDMRDGEECLLHVSHEGESAGIEIDLSLPGFLAQQAWLGPVWPDFSEVYAFSDRVEDVIAGDYRVQTADFGAESALGETWRGWFWGEVDPGPPDETLRRRCGAAIG